MWLTITVLASTIIGLIGGILSHATAHVLADAITAGAAAFAGAEAIFLAILMFALSADRDR
ncbi:hypothetical protein [Amycolatopsis mediterranei]|uniref:hypothetical protein n=1 Tax=Amycolatopsis mediterranei TaxID=33910 RepID=UPI00332C1264